MWNIMALYVFRCHLSYTSMYIIPNFYNWKNIKCTSEGNYALALKWVSLVDNLSLYSKVYVHYCLAGMCHKKQTIMTPLKENVS